MRTLIVPRRAWLSAIVFGLAVVGCGSDGDAKGADAGRRPDSERPADQADPEHDRSGAPAAPPPVVVRADGEAVELEPYSYCYETGCADGFPPTAPVDVGTAAEIEVEYPLDGWSFTASLARAGDDCSRVQQMPLQSRSDGTFLLQPAGPADTYDVTLFGEGRGDLVVEFRWTTTEDGPLPVPEARLAILAGHDGTVDSYGVEMEVRNLEATPAAASATITVTAPDGQAVSFEATREDVGCYEGSLYWGGPDDQGLAAAALADEGPFTYQVTLVLDGVPYVATATWPDDVIVGNEPSVALAFDPPLPALSATSAG